MLFRASSLILLVLGAASSASAAVAEETLSTALMTDFKKWVDYFGKQYDSHEEKMKRLEIWVNNNGKHYYCCAFL